MTSLRKSLLAFALLPLILTGCASLAADVTPPPGFQPTQAAEPVQVSAVLPMVPPNLENGAAIYAENCTPCHGETGRSDGPMSGELPQPAPELGNPEVAGAVRPVDWYLMISNGNLEMLMPGFAGSLNERERWDVTAYALMLSVSEETLQAGAEVYAAECQACHGELGRGDGPQAASLSADVPNWRQNPALLAEVSNLELKASISQGVPPAMPGFEGVLDAGELEAVTAYVRSLGFTGLSGSLAAGQPQISQTPQPEGTPAAMEGFMSIGGQVYNLSGGEVPTDLEVELTGYEGMTEVFSLTVPAEPDGAFRFEEVEVSPSRVYLASIVRNGVTYNSQVVHPESLVPGGSIDDLVIEFFDTTSDTSALKADRMHIFFEPTESGTVQVVELFILNNTSLHVIVPAGEDQPVFTVELPEGATNLRFEDGELGDKYIATENGFGDMHTILPGAGAQLLFGYEVPFDGSETISIPIPLPVDAAVIMTPLQGLELQSDQIVAAGQQAVENMQIKMYTAAHLQPGQRLEITMTDGSSPMAALGSLNQGIWIGALGFAVFLIAGGILLVRQRHGEAEEDEAEEEAPAEDTVESLLDQIIALDDLFRAGELPEEAYRQRRGELKQRLRELHGEE